ncbi:hypothetical protein ACMSDQ_09210 [Bacteroides thetaiotaomicron]|uniref:hypothetical protein n=2 Tax=Bacteroides thetaiotaomicron TaxID=818 RepID=UPI0039C03B30
MEAKSMEIKRKKQAKEKKKSNLPIDAITLNETKVKQVKKSFENPAKEHQANSSLVNF